MTEQRTGAWVPTFVTLVLSTAAAVALSFGVYLALGPEDTEPLESPLLLAVAHQLSHGPWELYGPFGGENPLVIIHAPLYYRLAALVAWPLVGAGVDQITAALAGGRGLSLLGLAWTMAAGYRLARLDGAPRTAGSWAALLIAASPVVDVMPFTVRPDMLGIALQTTGVLLVLSVLRAPKRRLAALPAAYTAFALAACTKQHFIVGPIVSTFLLLAACMRGRLSLRLVFLGLSSGLLVLLLVYGAEELASEGRMSRAIIEAAASSAQVHPVGWLRAAVVVTGIIGKSGGLIVMLLAAGLAGIAAQPGLVRRALVVVGTGLMIVITVRTILDTLHFLLTGWDVFVIFSAFGIALFLVLPACVLMSRPSRSIEWLDGTLALFLAAEFALVLVLSRASAGAWLNYGIQAIVFASVLTARALARTCAGGLRTMASILISLAALNFFVGVCHNAVATAESRSDEKIAIFHLLDHYKRPATEFFFVDRPGLNRLYGSPRLVYDHWLYPVFESTHLAQSRSIWLRNALTSGHVRFVVNTSESINIDGLGQTLPEMGYTRDVKVGTMFYVWQHSRFD
jgi:hypothetical protein